MTCVTRVLQVSSIQRSNDTNVFPSRKLKTGDSFDMIKRFANKSQLTGIFILLRKHNTAED